MLGNRIGLATAKERILAGNSVQTASQQQRYQQLGLQTRILTADPELKAYLLRAIDEGDRLSILDQLDERQSDLGYDFALLVDPQGRLLARTDQPDAPPVDLSKMPLIAKLLDEYEASGIWQEGDRIYEAVGVPLALTQNVFGFLAVGYAINDVRALEVKRVTGTEVAYLTATSAGASVVASTLASGQQDRLVAALRRQGNLLASVTQEGRAIDSVELQLEGGRWLALLAPLKDAAGKAAGASIAIASLDKELVGYQRIRESAARSRRSPRSSPRCSSPISSRGGSSGRSASSSRRRTRRAPATTTRRCRVGGPGEVAELSGAFNTLLADLRERRDMAAYVASLARSLPEPAARGDVPTRPEMQKVTVLGIELRRYSSPRQNADPEETLARLSRDLKRILNAVDSRERSPRGGLRPSGARELHRPDPLGARARRRGRDLEHGLGARELLRRRAAAGDRDRHRRRHDRRGERTPTPAERTLVGLPMQQVEGLLREASPGDILLSPGRPRRDRRRPRPARRRARTAARTALDAGDLSARRRARRSGSPGGTSRSRPTSLGVARVDPRRRPAVGGQGPARSLRHHHRHRSRARSSATRFEILSTLGAGGMGVVYKARDRELDDLVALKMLKREVVGDRSSGRAAEERAQAGAQDHPSERAAHLRLRRGRRRSVHLDGVRARRDAALDARAVGAPAVLGRPAARAAAVLRARRGARAVDPAPRHQAGEPDPRLAGNAKLMDFGIARPVHRLTPGQTQAGFIVGTPHYLAPEQLEGKEPDTRADIYACGVVLFEVFTGQLPFGGNERDGDHPQAPEGRAGLAARVLAGDPGRARAHPAALPREGARVADSPTPATSAKRSSGSRPEAAPGPPRAGRTSPVSGGAGTGGAGSF